MIYLKSILSVIYKLLFVIANKKKSVYCKFFFLTTLYQNQIIMYYFQVVLQ